MKRIVFLGIYLLFFIGIKAQCFDDFFQNKTLRIDYIFTGSNAQQSIHVDELSRLPFWAGRRSNLSLLLLEANGQIIMRDSATQQCIYKSSFSSLFQEWFSTNEAQNTAKGFENTFLLPYPKQTAEIEIALFDAERKSATTLKHTIRPTDILIRERGNSYITPHQFLLKNGSENECIDVVILAEGYTEEEMEQFYKDAKKTYESIFSYEPFKSMKNKFNIVAVASPSKDSGVSIPRENKWKNTAFNAHFDTFYSERYLTTSRVKNIHNALAGIPYEHIIVIANTSEYGGGGIYNSFTLTAAHHSSFKSVIAHEFGHSFAGLGDEYFYDDDDLLTDTYSFNIEPWEANLTTCVNFESKWKDMLPQNTPIPTPITQKEKFLIGVYEGGGYSAKGIYRPAFDCRMRTNEYPRFCAVCQRAIQQTIEFYTK